MAGERVTLTVLKPAYVRLTVHRLQQSSAQTHATARA